MEGLGGILSMGQKTDVYVVNLVTIISGFSMNNLSPKGRQFLGGFLGLAFVILLCGPQGIFPLTTIFVAVVWKLLPAFLKRQSTGLAFAIVIFLRVLYGMSEQVLGLKTHDFTLTNTLHMFVALRCISVIYEMSFYYQSKEGTEDSRKSIISPKLIKQEPTMSEFICYLLYAPAISLGPFYTYQTYHDSLHLSAVDFDSIPRATFLLRKMRKYFILYAVIFTKHQIFSDLDIFESKIHEFENFTYWKQMAYIFGNGFEASSFIALTWQLGESSCVAYGLGGYRYPSNSGQGPVEEEIDENANEMANEESREWNFDTISNGHGEYWMFESSLSVMFREWNRTTQWWLARYCYTASFIRKYPRLIRMLFTQLVNVYWHGIRPGYFISLMMMPLALICEQMWQGFVAKNVKTTTGKRINSIMTFILNFTTMSYIHLAFSLGDFNTIYTVYKLTFSTSLTLFSGMLFTVLCGESIHRYFNLVF